MINALMQEVDCWEYDIGFCEQNALNGIKRIAQMNTSHPISDGISLIYFIKKNCSDHDPLFGCRKIEWFYHCCLGFKDLYVGKDWFIDLSYHLMVGNTNKQKMTRMIERGQYIPNIPDTVAAYVIPLKNLPHFVNKIRVTQILKNWSEFLAISNSTGFVWIFHTPKLLTVKSMLNSSLIFKCDNMQN